MTVEIVVFTARGAALADRLRACLPGCSATAPARYCRPGMTPLEPDLAGWTAARFRTGAALVFVGAVGIAVRAIAPLIAGKATDPAVVVADDTGRYVIPLLSGHLGGANRLARQIAALIGAEAVITTATDRAGVFAPDAWAAENGCAVADTAAIRRIAAALLDGEAVGFRSAFPVAGPLPAGVEARTDTRCGIEIAWAAEMPFAHTLHLLPRSVVAGIGCRKGVGADTLRRRLGQALAAANLPEAVVGAVASIDRKGEEPGLLALCESLQAEFRTFPAAALMALPGNFTPSERVLAITGADNVCERAAVAAGGELILRKQAGDGVTVALAHREWTARFTEEEIV